MSARFPTLGERSHGGGGEGRITEGRSKNWKHGDGEHIFVHFGTDVRIDHVIVTASRQIIVGFRANSMAPRLRFMATTKGLGHLSMYDITRFTLADMATCGAQLREMSADATSMEDVGGAIARYLYENLHVANGRACVMVRFYKTHPYGELPAELRDFGHDIMPAQSLTPDTKCLTLLGTAGDLPEWNNRHASRRHRSIPLPSKQVIEQIPMIAQMVRQFGLEISSLLETKPEIISELDQKTYNVFFVPDARISPFIPAQAEFVVPYGVKSALGFGGVLPSGNLFAVIMFTRVPIPIETAQMFRTIALNVKINILRFVGRKVFAD